MSSSNSLPESYFFNKCLFPALCVPSSQQLKCNIEQKRVSVLQCNKTLLPLATETPPAIGGAQEENFKLERTANMVFVESGKSIFLKSQFCWL